MGEYAEMMLDGTCCEGCGTYMGRSTGYPGYCSRQCAGDRGAAQRTVRIQPTGKRAKAPFQMTAEIRAAVALVGDMEMLDPYHWQVRRDGAVLADWWPHKGKFRIRQVVIQGDAAALIHALQSLPPKEG